MKDDKIKFGKSDLWYQWLPEGYNKYRIRVREVSTTPCAWQCGTCGEWNMGKVSESTGCDFCCHA